MSAQMNPQARSHGKAPGDHPEFLSMRQVGAIGALMLVAVGIVFFLGQLEILSFSSPWWVLFLAIPGAVLVWTAFANSRRRGFDALAGTQGLLGALLLLAALIMVLDPQWSFTQRWQIDAFRRINWDVVWPWALVVPGAALLVLAAVERSVGTAIPGAFLVVAGAVFILGISWDVVWPLVLVAVGAVVLASLLLRRTTTA